MSKNAFIVLGVSETATQNELFDAYRELRDKYSNLRFSPGEVGTEACRKLEEVEEAYAQASDILRSNYEIKSFGDDLNRIEEAIKENNLDKAQSLLDEETNRTSKWHYFQSVVFYRKGWLNDAMKQLDFACNLEPLNTKYTEAREALFRQMFTNTTNPQGSFYGEQKEGERSYRNVPPQQAARGCSPCDCCTGLICADCCCECGGGDLISCC